MAGGRTEARNYGRNVHRWQAADSITVNLISDKSLNV